MSEDHKIFLNLYTIVNGKEQIMHSRDLNHYDADEFLRFAKDSKFVHYRYRCSKCGNEMEGEPHE